ncbi:MAG: phospholipid carrier-dependent glycosyltransferase, partial [Anaerolineales bacterium]|nr:phospholipid carrier-dependent glycosyltransferase [Anaerolineales bacterium]
MLFLKRLIGALPAHGLLLALALYAPLAVAYGLVTPIYEGPDEIGHVLFARDIAEGRGLPVQSAEYAAAHACGQEASQAPLYYALNAGVVRLLGLSLSEVPNRPEDNPFSTCGQPEAGHNIAGYRHDLQRESFPYKGEAARAIHMMRLFSALLGMVTVAAVYATTRLAFPGVPRAAFMAAVFVALNPQFAFMGGVVNNDNLVNCLTSLALALTLYGLRRGFTWWYVLALGAVCGLATLAKMGGLMTLAFAGLALLVALWRRPARLVAYGALLGSSFAVVAGWWFIRNWTLYGDPTGMSAMLAAYGGRDGGWPAHLLLPELVATARSYWGSFACDLQFPDAVYWGFGLLTVVAVAGWLPGWKIVSRQHRVTAGLLAVWLGMVVVSWVRWNQITYAPLGRLWFQASAASGALVGYGLAQWTKRARWLPAVLAAAMWIVALTGVVGVVRPAFALPDRHPAHASPAPDVLISQAHFDDQIRVRGYSLSTRSLELGETLAVDLFLEAMQPIPEDYAMALQLVSPVEGDQSTLLNFNTLPGSGNYPTLFWQPGEVIVDRYRLRMPEDVQRTQAWRLMLVFYRLSDGYRLPVVIDGQPAGEMLGLGLIRVGGETASEAPPRTPDGAQPVFG